MKSTPEINTNTMFKPGSHANLYINKKNSKKMYRVLLCAESIVSGSKHGDSEVKRWRWKNGKLWCFMEWKYLRGGGWRRKAEWEKERERERKAKQTQLGERKKKKIFRSSEKPRLIAYVAMIFSSHLTPRVTSSYSAHSSSCIHIHAHPSSLHIHIHPALICNFTYYFSLNFFASSLVLLNKSL